MVWPADNSVFPATAALARMRWWWCRRTADAERVAAAATARIRRLESKDAVPDASVALLQTEKAIAAAAARLGVALYSAEEISRQAADVIVRVDEQLQRLRRAGELKAINASYRRLRLQASARGEKVAPYAQWINKYRHDLVRQLAAALR